MAFLLIYIQNEVFDPQLAVHVLFNSIHISIIVVFTKQKSDSSSTWGGGGGGGGGVYACVDFLHVTCEECFIENCIGLFFCLVHVIVVGNQKRKYFSNESHALIFFW